MPSRRIAATPAGPFAAEELEPELYARLHSDATCSARAARALQAQACRWQRKSGSCGGRDRWRRRIAPNAPGLLPFEAVEPRLGAPQPRPMMSYVGSHPIRKMIPMRIGSLMSAWMSPHRLIVTSCQLRLARIARKTAITTQNKRLQKLHRAEV